MRAVWIGLGVLAAAAFVLAGCASTDPSKPPKHPEEYVTPPVEDARYSQPPAYPKGTLNNDRIPVAGPNGLNSMPRSQSGGLGGSGSMGGPGRY